jgi:hypothetical protein
VCVCVFAKELCCVVEVFLTDARGFPQEVL